MTSYNTYEPGDRLYAADINSVMRTSAFVDDFAPIRLDQESTLVSTTVFKHPLTPDFLNIINASEEKTDICYFVPVWTCMFTPYLVDTHPEFGPIQEDDVMLGPIFDNTITDLFYFLGFAQISASTIQYIKLTDGTNFVAYAPLCYVSDRYPRKYTTLDYWITDIYTNGGTWESVSAPMSTIFSPPPFLHPNGHNAATTAFLTYTLNKTPYKAFRYTGIEDDDEVNLFKISALVSYDPSAITFRANVKNDGSLYITNYGTKALYINGFWSADMNLPNYASLVFNFNAPSAQIELKDDETYNIFNWYGCPVMMHAGLSNSYMDYKYLCANGVPYNPWGTAHWDEYAVCYVMDTLECPRFGD